MKKNKKNMLKLDLDSFFGGDYFYTEYDIGCEGHSIIIKKKDKDVFIEAFLKELKERLESDLVECNEDGDVEE